MTALRRVHFRERFESAPPMPRRAMVHKRVRRINGIPIAHIETAAYDWTRTVFQSVWNAAADELIACGWGDVDRHRVPENWRAKRGPCQK